MKRLMLFILLILPFCVSAQDNWVFSEVVEAKDASAKDLYMRCKSWFDTSFKDSRNVLVSDNVETGIIANASMPVNFKSGIMMRSIYIKFRMEVYFKDNRYKFEFKDFYHENPTNKQYPLEGGSLTNVKPACGTMMFTMKDWGKVKEITQTETASLLAALKLKMSTPIESKKDNW